MAIDLNLGGQGAAQSDIVNVKLREPGVAWIGMLVNIDPKAPVYVFGSTNGEHELKSDGTPKTQDVLTVLICDGTTATDSDDNVLQPGTIARRYIKGHHRYTSDRGADGSFRTAVEAFTTEHGRGLRVGDLIREEYVEDTMVGYGGRRLTQAKHLHTYRVRPPKPDELGLVEQAERLHLEQRDGVALTDAPAPDGPTAAPATAATSDW